MPRKSIHGGHKKRRRGRITKPTSIEYADSEIGQRYGTVEKALGNCHFHITTLDGELKVASLSGTLKRSGRVKTGDLILMEPLTDNDDKKYKIIFKYTDKQRKTLEKEGRLKVLKDTNEDDEEDEIAFEGDDDTNDTNVEEVDENFIDDI